MDLAYNIFRLRKSLGYTQRQFAELLGVTQVAVHGWEKGIRVPDLKTINKIAATFHVPVSSLLPSGSDLSDDFVAQMAASLHENPKLALLFDRTKLMNADDLDVVLSVVQAITKEREQND